MAFESIELNWHGSPEATVCLEQLSKQKAGRSRNATRGLRSARFPHLDLFGYLSPILEIGAEPNHFFNFWPSGIFSS